mmetsp:Transcript_40789/g.73680  ORF Transcript_40789/g.73680 Transcript_40789/m.73680 type:complete len:224 (-) Transcript_40789:16-687(-)
MTAMYTEDASLLGFMDAVADDHARMKAALQQRLELAQQWRGHWRAGSVDAILDADGKEDKEPSESRRRQSLQSQGRRRESFQPSAGNISIRDASLHSLLTRLAKETSPLPPQVLVKLLPVAKQAAAGAEREELAVAAMRFVLQIISTSWPPVLHALQTVSTSRSCRLMCDEVVGQLCSMFALIKGMSRSVRLSKSNGCLVPVCRKLKVALDEALKPELRHRQT